MVFFSKITPYDPISYNIHIEISYISYSIFDFWIACFQFTNCQVTGLPLNGYHILGAIQKPRSQLGGGRGQPKGHERLRWGGGSFPKVHVAKNDWKFIKFSAFLSGTLEHIKINFIFLMSSLIPYNLNGLLFTLIITLIIIRLWDYKFHTVLF